MGRGVSERRRGTKIPWDDGNVLSLSWDGGYSMGRMSKFIKLHM